MSKGHSHFGELQDEWLGWAVESQENIDERKPTAVYQPGRAVVHGFYLRRALWEAPGSAHPSHCVLSGSDSEV